MKPDETAFARKLAEDTGSKMIVSVGRWSYIAKQAAREGISDICLAFGVVAGRCARCRNKVVISPTSRALLAAAPDATEVVCQRCYDPRKNEHLQILTRSHAEEEERIDTIRKQWRGRGGAA
jgi:hypothetical protein